MLPFAREQFLGVFAEYNLGVWPVQLLAYALGVVMVALLFRPSRAGGRIVGAGLCAMWLWTGVVYHGITPCPVTIFTFGLLLTSVGVSTWLYLIPLLWSLIGGSAAFLLGIPQDWVLLVSGVAVALMLFRHGHRHSSATPTT